jgi:protoporphyrinogen IX oxidase
MFWTPDVYLSIKALHIVAVISWMAGLLYLPRLFVYHSNVPKLSDPSELFKIMEYRLYRYIMTPAMVVTVLSGVYIAYFGAHYESYWFMTKALLVVLMIGVHFILGRHLSEFNEDRSTASSKYFRVINEVPTLLMIAVVALAVVRPF